MRMSPESLEITTPRREPTLELDLLLIEEEEVEAKTLEQALTDETPSQSGERTIEAEASRALRRARSLHTSGAVRLGVIGHGDARARFEMCLARAERSPAHAVDAAVLRARLMREDGRTDDAITELKRALHLTRDRAAMTSIFGEIADIYVMRGERRESTYYAKRAGRAVPANDTRPQRALSSARVPPPRRTAPPPPPRPR